MGAFFRELWTFMKVRRKLWLLPIVVMAMVFGGVAVLTNGPLDAPFVYSVFYPSGA